ncbi:hypothetical protein CRG98_021625 [Punica granatum]|uniref:Uncharacterized protein n=1 Tax=Punica granatum TaxID=22663 RepID=A0A2I0JNV3_PUNGR|nr:hypothetical protein CRG98_021625 [Punica granatum]
MVSFQALLEPDQITPPPAREEGPISRKLETILSDSSQLVCPKLWSAMMIELKLLFHRAAPAVVYMINYVMSMSTRIFSGHLGNLELAVASLGNTGIQIFTCGFMRATFLLTATGVLLSIIYIFSKAILILLRESPQIASAAATFVFGLIPQIFTYANFPIQRFLQAQSIVAPMAGQFVYIVKSDRCNYTWAGFSAEAFTGLFGFLKLSAASSVMLCLEAWYFQGPRPHHRSPRRGEAVGCGWQAMVAYINVGCYYGVGVPLGSLLGFYFKLGAKATASISYPDDTISDSSSYRLLISIYGQSNGP